MASRAADPLDRSLANDAAVSIRRFVNDEVATAAGSADVSDGAEFEFLCECGDLACTNTVRMTLADYSNTSPGSVLGH